MPDTPNSSATNAQANPGSSPAPTQSGTTNAASVSQPNAKGFTLPAELQGKSPDEIGQYYSSKLDGYKDYDQLKERAGKYGDYEALKLTPEQIRANTDWVTNILGGLQQGKAARFDAKTNTITWVDAQGNVQQAPANQQQQQDWRGQDWEMADENTRADRMAKHVWEDSLRPEVNRVVEQYNQQFAQALAGLDQKFNLFMDAVEQWQANPGKLKLREVISRANQMMQTKPGDYIKLAAEQIMSPEQQEQEIQTRVAAQLAEEKLKLEAQYNKAPILPAALSGAHRPVTEGPKTLAEVRAQMIRRANGAA